MSAAQEYVEPSLPEQPLEEYTLGVPLRFNVQGKFKNSRISSVNKKFQYWCDCSNEVEVSVNSLPPRAKKPVEQ